MLLICIFSLLFLLWARWADLVMNLFWEELADIDPPPVVVIKGGSDGREWPRVRVVNK